MAGEETFSTRIPEPMLLVLLESGRRLEFDPLSSNDAEAFFLCLSDEVTARGGLEATGVREWLEARLDQAFRIVKHRPRWIQGADWQFSGGGPMVFVGQLDESARATGLHDEASFYVFWNPETGEAKTIIQVA